MSSDTVSTELGKFARWVECLTPEDEGKVQDLRARLDARGLLHEHRSDHATLARFLQARHWNVERAEAMYRKMGAGPAGARVRCGVHAWQRANVTCRWLPLPAVEWREERDVDSLPYRFSLPNHVTRELFLESPSFWTGVDRFGRPVFVDLGTRGDIS